jgi:hypothetical protein
MEENNIRNEQETTEEETTEQSVEINDELIKKSYGSFRG